MQMKIRACVKCINTLITLQRARINREELLLGLESQTSDHMLHDLAAKKEPFDKLWTNAVHFHQQHEKWMSGPLLLVNAEEVEEEVCGRIH